MEVEMPNEYWIGADSMSLAFWTRKSWAGEIDVGMMSILSLLIRDRMTSPRAWVCLEKGNSTKPEFWLGRCEKTNKGNKGDAREMGGKPGECSLPETKCRRCFKETDQILLINQRVTSQYSVHWSTEVQWTEYWEVTCWFKNVEVKGDLVKCTCNEK